MWPDGPTGIHFDNVDMSVASAAGHLGRPRAGGLECDDLFDRKLEEVDQGHPTLSTNRSALLSVADTNRERSCVSSVSTGRGTSSGSRTVLEVDAAVGAALLDDASSDRCTVPGRRASPLGNLITSFWAERCSDD